MIHKPSTNSKRIPKLFKRVTLLSKWNTFWRWSQNQSLTKNKRLVNSENSLLRRLWRNLTDTLKYKKRRIILIDFRSRSNKPEIVRTETYKWWNWYLMLEPVKGCSIDKVRKRPRTIKECLEEKKSLRTFQNSIHLKRRGIWLGCRQIAQVIINLNRICLL